MPAPSPSFRRAHPTASPFHHATNLLITTNFPWKNNAAIFCRNSFLPYFCTPKNKAPTRLVERKDSVAQLVEQYTFNVWVLGSSPSGITTKIEAFKSMDLKALFLKQFEYFFQRSTLASFNITA
jgi:hypothetical protein